MYTIVHGLYECIRVHSNVRDTQLSNSNTCTCVTSTFVTPNLLSPIVTTIFPQRPSPAVCGDELPMRPLLMLDQKTSPALARQHSPTLINASGCLNGTIADSGMPGTQREINCQTALALAATARSSKVTSFLR